MQSLLCSDLLPASLRPQVLELLEQSSLLESENYVSLKVLCLPPAKALALLLNSYPAAVLEFMMHKFPEDSGEWVSLYTSVSMKLQAASKKKKQEYAEYVKQCMERYQAKLLREKIVALGTELKDMM
ncbi:hypothetical protein MRX96_048439 [Rhipicephalus microplus]